MKFKEIKETELAEFPTNEEDVLGDNNTALDNSHSQSTDIPLLSLNLLLVYIYIYILLLHIFLKV